MSEKPPISTALDPADEADIERRYAEAVGALEAWRDRTPSDAPATRETVVDETSGTIAALGPSDAATEDIDGDESPFYLREWRGGPLYGCPMCDFTGRTHRSILRHADEAHPKVPEPDIEQRARNAGLTLARR